MDLNKLKEPFHPEDIEWRIQRSGLKNGKPWGMCLAYVTNRAIMDRLDDVCGPNGWMNIFRKAPDGGILCGISIKCDDDWIIKWDGAPNTDIESVKGGLSNAMKRAAVQWGIGRYLYKLEAGWATFDDNGKYSAKLKDNNFYKWNPPQLPTWALPKNESKKQPEKSMTKADYKKFTELCDKEGLVIESTAKMYGIESGITKIQFNSFYAQILQDIHGNLIDSSLLRG